MATSHTCRELKTHLEHTTVNERKPVPILIHMDIRIPNFLCSCDAVPAGKKGLAITKGTH